MNPDDLEDLKDEARDLAKKISILSKGIEPKIVSAALCHNLAKLIAYSNDPVGHHLFSIVAISEAVEWELNNAKGE